MAFKIGIVGSPNTGKSYSRKFIEKGEEVFVVAPSAKMMHITDSSGKPLKKFNISMGGKNSDELAKMANVDIHHLFPLIKGKPYETSGNYIVCKLENVKDYLTFINDNMPQIKTIIIPDFTHFISAILANRDFIKRKSGGEAFQRFWELAGDVLESLMIHIDSLRDDLIVVTEYHCEYDENSDNWVIFVPGGKMLTEKFKLDSYYDFMLYTHAEQNESGEVTRYCFVTKKWGKYNARSCGLFEDTLIDNNLQTVISKVREYNGI